MRSTGPACAIDALAARLRLHRVPDVWLVIIVFAAAGAGGTWMVHYRQSHVVHYPRFTVAEMRVHVARGDALILDSRGRNDFLAGHLPGAVNLPVDELNRRSHELDSIIREHSDRLVIVYCTNIWCGQAEDLQQALIAAGHRRLGVFAEGFEAWRETGGAVVSP